MTTADVFMIKRQFAGLFSLSVLYGADLGRSTITYCGYGCFMWEVKQ
jgi:hypothetical protein